LDIPEELKRNLLNELEFVVKKMKEESDASKKMYFFTATYGAIERVMRYYSNNELAIAHAILNLCYNTLNERIHRLKSGDAAVPLPQNLFEHLVNYTEEFRRAIEENKSTYPILEKFIELAYLSTGPGFYSRSLLEYLKSREHVPEG